MTSKRRVPAREKVVGLRARSPETKQAVYEQLLRNAIELYCETGYDGFSIRKLAERSGFSPSSLYRYFDSKDAVFAQLVDMGFKRMEDRLSEVKADNLADYLMAFARAYLAFATSEPQLYRLMTTEHPPDSVKLDETTTRRRWKVFSILGNAAHDFGLDVLDAAPENTAATDMLWAFGHGLASLAISLPYFSEERAERALNFAYSQFKPLVMALIAAKEVSPKVTG